MYKRRIEIEAHTQNNDTVNLVNSKVRRLIACRIMNTWFFSLVVIFGLVIVRHVSPQSTSTPTLNATFPPECNDIPCLIKTFVDGVEIPESAPTLPMNKNVKIMALITEDAERYYNISYEWDLDGKIVEPRNMSVIYHTFKPFTEYNLIVRITAQKKGCIRRNMMGVHHRRWAELNYYGVPVSTTIDNLEVDNFMDHEYISKPYWNYSTTTPTPFPSDNKSNRAMFYVLLSLFVVLSLFGVFVMYAAVLWFVFNRQLPFHRWWDHIVGNRRSINNETPFGGGQGGSIQFSEDHQMVRLGPIYHSADHAVEPIHESIICGLGKSLSTCELVDEHSRMDYEDLSKQDDTVIIRKDTTKRIQDNNHHLPFIVGLTGTYTKSNRTKTSNESSKKFEMIDLYQGEVSSTYQGLFETSLITI